MKNKIIEALENAIIYVPPKKIINAFKRAAQNIPAYKKILSEKGLQHERVKTLEDFSHMVPVLYKRDLFKDCSSEDLCMPGSIKSLASAIVTSGTSGAFAYKIITKRELDLEKKMIDRAFNMFFNAGKLKTAVINVNPMGVSFTSNYPVIPTSVRSDIAWHVIKSFSAKLDQILVVGDPNFMKKLIEEGRQIGFHGAAEKLKFIMGGDWSSLSYFEYLKGAINAQNPDNLFNTFGTTEIGLNVGMADKSLQAVRKFIQTNKKVQKDIFGMELKTAPALFFFDPRRTYIEKINRDLPFSELAFTTLSDLSMPFIRYSSGDYGTLLNGKTINTILKNNGITGLDFTLPLPILAITGRISNQVKSGEFTLTAEDVKEMLYSSVEVAQNITGNFRLSPTETSFKIEVQLARGVKPITMQGLIKKSVETLGKSILIKTFEYHKFPYNMVLDYESKWAYTKV